MERARCLVNYLRHSWRVYTQLRVLVWISCVTTILYEARNWFIWSQWGEGYSQSFGLMEDVVKDHGFDIQKLSGCKVLNFVTCAELIRIYLFYYLVVIKKLCFHDGHM